LDAEGFRIYRSILKYVTADSDSVLRQNKPTPWGEGFWRTPNEKSDNDASIVFRIFRSPYIQNPFVKQQLIYETGHKNPPKTTTCG